jgi:tRNA(adenine34) deaminase
MKDDLHWMGHAIAEAQRALAEDEVPVGAVVVHEGQVVGKGHNRTERTGFPFEHAEVVAMWDAVEKHDRWILTNSVLYVTVEPCVMCIGAVLLARVPKVVFGAREPKTGACESILSIPHEPLLEHSVAVVGGVEESKCRDLLRDFFKAQRRKRAG